jgi:hypothetical protein
MAFSKSLPNSFSGERPGKRLKLCALRCHLGHPVPGRSSCITVNQSEHKFVPERSTLFEFQWNFLLVEHSPPQESSPCSSNPIERRDGAEIVKWVDDHGGAGLATAKYLGPHVVRAFNAIGYAKLSTDAHRQGELVGVPIAGDDAHAIDIASSLIREIGFDPVVIGGLAMGKYLVPGTPLGGEHTAAEIRQIVTSLH